MEKFKKISILICNILCAVLMLFILVGQFVPFWNVQGAVTDKASLIGVTGRQYAHEDLIESINVTSGGFTYHDISTQVLVIIVAGAFGLLNTVCKLKRTGHGIFGLAVALFGLHLWVTVPAFTMVNLGNLLYYAFVALLVGSSYLMFWYLLDKFVGESDASQADSRKETIATIVMAVVFSLIFVIFANNIKDTFDKKAEENKISDNANKQQIMKLEGKLAEMEAQLKAYEEAEATEPEVTEPEATDPDVTEPEVTEPEATDPDATEPEATDPEVTEPEITESEVTDPEVTESEVTEP